MYENYSPFGEDKRRGAGGTSLVRATWLRFSARFSRSWRKSPKSAAVRTNINNGMIMNQIVREKPISYWPTGANDWPAVYPHSASPRSRRSSFSLALSPSHAHIYLSLVLLARSLSVITHRSRCTRSLQPDSHHLPCFSHPFASRLDSRIFPPFFCPRVAFPLAAVSLQRHERDRTTHTVHIFQLI